MKIVCRKVTSIDLPAIQDLSDSMDMRNDPKIGDKAEALILESKCTLYGAYKDGLLIGVGGLRDKGWELAWIESIRVHGEYQRVGVGTALFRHGEKLAKELGYQRVGFQTETENAGSCRIGETLGFQRKHEMTAFYAPRETLAQRDDEHRTQRAVSVEEALSALKRIPNGPKDEICAGWEYAPLSAEFFHSELGMKFYIQDETVMLEFHDRDPNTREVAWIKAILYGAGVGIESLLFGFLARNAKLRLPLFCLCPQGLIPHVLQMGFQYMRVWTGGRNIVVLFTKDLQ